MKKSINAIYGCIILLATIPTTVIRHIVATLKMPVKANDFITYAKKIYKAMNGNTNFPNSQATVTQLNTDIATLVTMQTNLKTKPPTATVKDRNGAIDDVKKDLRDLRNDVQKIADANPKKAEAIITSASMEIKKVNPRQKQDDNAKEGEVSGSIVLTATGGGPHEWQISKDMINIINLDATSTAKTTKDGLTSGDEYYTRNRPILKNGKKGDWSKWIKVRVK